MGPSKISFRDAVLATVSLQTAEHRPAPATSDSDDYSVIRSTNKHQERPTHAKGGTVGCLPQSHQLRPRLMAPVAPLVMWIPGSAARSTGRTGTSAGRRPAEAAPVPVPLWTTRLAGRPSRASSTRAAMVFHRARSTGALRAIRPNETRQLSLRLAVPDAIGTGGRLLMAHWLDIWCIPADELAMRFLSAARSSADR
jgi:hypothetical protein